MTTPKKMLPRKKTAKKSTAGQRILDAIEELSTPAAIDAAILGKGRDPKTYPIPALHGRDIAAIRAELGQTQSSFAAFLNVAVQTVQAWEQEQNRPSGIALRFLTAIRPICPTGRSN